VRAKTISAVIVAAVISIQFIPVDRTNPIGAGGPEISEDLQWALRRSCYDCHSNETRWPVWAYVAPISWLVVRDVDAARAILNFSEWAAYEPGVRIALRSMVGPTTAVHRMPLWYYLPLHPDSQLSESERTALSAWASGASSEADTPAVNGSR